MGASVVNNFDELGLGFIDMAVFIHLLVFFCWIESGFGSTFGEFYGVISSGLRKKVR